MVACRTGRPNFVKILVDGNADQSVRNVRGENIMHAVLEDTPSPHRLAPLIKHLDADLVAHLMVQRNNLSENGLTPLHYWVCKATGASTQSIRNYQTSRYSRYYNYRSEPTMEYEDPAAIKLLNILLKAARGEGLELLNGPGDTPLHTAIMQDATSIARTLINFNPRLLNRENAVGRTPAEMAHDRLIAERLSKPDTIENRSGEVFSGLPQRSPASFVKKEGEEEPSPEQVASKLSEVGLSGVYKPAYLRSILDLLGEGTSKSAYLLVKEVKLRVMWDICSTAMERFPSQRRLVSLNEANDVAKRLADSYTASRYFTVSTYGADGEEKHVDDYATVQLGNRKRYAWTVPEYKGKESGWRKCPECEHYHEED